MENKENEREERKGNGIFLGIIGVATLIVAIIGASFAYFSIQASSAEGAVNLTAYEFSASLSMSEVYPTEKDLIPIDPMGAVTGATPGADSTNLAFALNVRKKCEDDKGYRVCALYEVSVTNSGTEEMVLNGTIVTNENNASNERTGGTPFENLQYREVTKSGDAYTIGSTAVDLATAVGGTANIGSLTVPAGETKTTYVLIYLNEKKGENEETHEMEAKDQSSEIGATYKGQIVYTSTGTGNRLTGTFTVS